MLIKKQGLNKYVRLLTRLYSNCTMCMHNLQRCEQIGKALNLPSTTVLGGYVILCRFNCVSCKCESPPD